MPVYVALVRAVNVGGTGKLAMSRLKSICADAGFDRVERVRAGRELANRAGNAERTFVVGNQDHVRCPRVCVRQHAPEGTGAGTVRSGAYAALCQNHVT